MNVNDVEFVEETGDRLELIFKKQHSLYEKYVGIEEKQGVGYGILGGKPFDINNIRSQCLIKDFAWRVTEELTEATDCHPIIEKTHLLEELSDALHFLVELCLISGITPNEIVQELRDPEIHPDSLVALCSIRINLNPNPNHSMNPYAIIQQLGLAMNCLKLKPWKQTHVLTDIEKFRKHIIFAFHEFCSFWVHCGSNSEELYSYYFKKNKVNEFRQRSNY